MMRKSENSKELKIFFFYKKLDKITKVIMATNKNSDKNNKSPKTFNPYWIYALLLLFIITTFFLNPNSTTKEISWLQFEQNILKKQDVEKIIIINKEIAEIFIKQEDDKDKSTS